MLSRSNEKKTSQLCNNLLENKCQIKQDTVPFRKQTTRVIDVITSQSRDFHNNTMSHSIDEHSQLLPIVCLSHRDKQKRFETKTQDEELIIRQQNELDRNLSFKSSESSRSSKSPKILNLKPNKMKKSTRKTRQIHLSIITLILATLLYCFQHQVITSNGFLLFENLSNADSNDKTTTATTNNNQAPSNTNSLMATIIDTAAKAAISSLSSQTQAEHQSPLIATAKSLGASNSPSPSAVSAAAASPAAVTGPAPATITAVANNGRQLSSSSAPSSIVASLSSAVASAAVASAVAAARNSLGPSRLNAKSSTNKLHSSQNLQTLSRSSNSINNVKSTQQNNNHNNPLNHIAMRLADAIPEVPYNILHNMKKLDHAAPFYNVDSSPVSKASGSQASLAAAAGGGIRKSESSPLSAALSSLLNSAISAASASATSGNSIDQIGALFRTPLWRRLADGAGDFAAEFRSFFKPGSGASSTAAAAASPTSISGPSKASGSIGPLSQLGSMSNLMRELSVSVPVVMYLANKVMKSDVSI